MSKKLDWGDVDMVTAQGGNAYNNRNIGDYRLKLTGAPGEGARYKVRFLGKAMAFVAHYDSKRDPKSGELNKCDFPDADTNKRFTRVCTDEDAASEQRPSHCPWCVLGYDARQRFLLNVADYGDLDEDGDPKIKFIELPKTAFKILADWHKENKEDYPGGPGDLEGPAPDFVIIVTKTSSKGRGGGGTTYSIQSKGAAKPLPESVVNAIKKLNPGAETPEDEMKLLDLERLCYPTYMSRDLQKLKFNGKVIDQVPRSERESQDEEGEAPAKPKPAAAAPQVNDDDDDDEVPTSKPAPAVEDDDDDDAGPGTASFDEDDDDDIGSTKVHSSSGGDDGGEASDESLSW